MAIAARIARASVGRLPLVALALVAIPAVAQDVRLIARLDSAAWTLYGFQPTIPAIGATAQAQVFMIGAKDGLALHFISTIERQPQPQPQPQRPSIG